MKQTKLMRTLSSRNCSKVFSAKLNKAFDQALENGSAEVVDANNDLAIATVGNDIVVEDKINNEVTKFTPNPEVENDLVMEAIVDVPENENYCDTTGRKFSQPEEPKATEEYKNTPAVGYKSETHEINTLPEVEVVVNEGVTDNEKSGTIPFSVKMRNIPSSRTYSVIRALRKAFSDEPEATNVSNEAIQNIANAVVNAVNEKVENIVNNVVEEVKTESKQTRKAFCDGQMSEDTADAIVNAVVNEVKNVVANEVKNAVEEVKVESKKFAEEANATENAAENAAANAAETATNEVENLKEEIANEVKEEVVEEVTEQAVEQVTDELEQLVNDAIVEPKAEITETEETIEDKSESKKFSKSNGSELSRLLNVKFN